MSIWTYEQLEKFTNNWEKKLGAGGFGSVFLGKHPSGTLVAVKRLEQSQALAELAGISSLEQFAAEVSTLSKYAHPKLLTLMGTSQDKCPCLVYEYMPKGSLEERLADDSLSELIRVRILAEVVEGVGYLHDAGMAHRDLKTANILMDDRFGARIGDFGLVKPIKDAEGMAQTSLQTDQVLGSLVYMAPEVHQGLDSLARDVYAFGVVILEVLTSLPAANPVPEHQSIVMLAQDAWDEAAGMRAKAHPVFAPGSVDPLSDMAERCLEHRYKKRPGIGMLLSPLHELCALCTERAESSPAEQAGARVKSTRLCATGQMADQFLRCLQIEPEYLDPKHDRCYCAECYPHSWADKISNEGPTDYVVPRGWYRVGLSLPPRVKVLDVFEQWSASFHGVKSVPVLRSILDCGQLLKPGDTLLDGTVLGSTKCAGRQDKVYYTSPTINYAGLKFYAEPQRFNTEDEEEMAGCMALQCRQKPGTFKTQGETMGFDDWPGYLAKHCGEVSLSELEWRSKANAATIPYGLMLRTYKWGCDGNAYRSPVDEGCPWQVQEQLAEEKLRGGKGAAPESTSSSDDDSSFGLLDWLAESVGLRDKKEASGTPPEQPLNITKREETKKRREAKAEAVKKKAEAAEAKALEEAQKKEEKPKTIRKARTRAKNLDPEQRALQKRAWEVDLRKAAERGDTSALELVAKHAPERISQPGPGNEVAAIHTAAEHGQHAAVQILVFAGADVNHANKSGITPLYIAASRGHHRTVEALLETGAVANQPNQNGATPLYIAAAKEHLETIKVLLRAKADVNVAKQMNVTPLYYAACHGHLAALEVLLQAKADVNLAKDDGSTPLTIAENQGHEAVARILREIRRRKSQDLQ
eukprot:TRINITY_DN10592_c0_g4_i3.p1 TRINITY_DN10592_c0_g4~~TRINITY_DN10592_c0_g4_i3.p1  ORF type:complete len:867 (-),score=296.48 TRINITY_DN10592_c0_g4_i3:122-2722(-)